MFYCLLSFIFAASFGAFIRYQIGLNSHFLWGTLAVNIMGSVLIGFLSIYLDRHYPQYKIIVMVAFLGSLTTFSSYSLDIIKLFEQGLVGKALLYAFSSNILCVIGCYWGWKWAQSSIN